MTPLKALAKRPDRASAAELKAACGGNRYLVALVIDSLSTGLLRPFILLYAVIVADTDVVTAGFALTAGMVFGLALLPGVGWWLDTGARRTPLVSSLLVRVVGLGVLLVVGGPVGFFAAALMLGAGSQAWPSAHAALVSSLSEGRLRDEALAATRAARNAGTGAGALIATIAVAAGEEAMVYLALATAIGLVVAAVLLMGVRDGSVNHSSRRMVTSKDGSARTRATEGDADDAGAGGAATDAETAASQKVPGLALFHVANAPFALCFDVLEVALPAVLVLQMHASPAWSSVVFITNTVMVVVLQLMVVMWLERYERRRSFALSGFVLALSYLGFWAAGAAQGPSGPVLICVVAVFYTFGEIAYTGTSTALVVAAAPPARLGKELARFHISYGVGRAASPFVLTALFALSPALLWVGLAMATALAGAATLRFGPADAPSGRAVDGAAKEHSLGQAIAGEADVETPPAGLVALAAFDGVGPVVSADATCPNETRTMEGSPPGSRP